MPLHGRSAISLSPGSRDSFTGCHQKCVKRHFIRHGLRSTEANSAAAQTLTARGVVTTTLRGKNSRNAGLLASLNNYIINRPIAKLRNVAGQRSKRRSFEEVLEIATGSALTLLARTQNLHERLGGLVLSCSLSEKYHTQGDRSDIFKVHSSLEVSSCLPEWILPPLSCL